jgi:serine-type D-Ala-D-Ala carboxypeptidase/endopeptidase
MMFDLRSRGLPIALLTAWSLTVTFTASMADTPAAVPAAASAVAPVAPAPAAASGPVPAAAAATAAEVDAELLRQLKLRVDVQQQATGAVIGIIDGGGRRVIAYGTTAKGNGQPVTGDTVFAIGSITKVFTALLLADMASKHELALDDAVATYLPRAVRVPSSGGRQITLLDLATHTSGLPLRPDNLVSKDLENKYAGYTASRLFRFLTSFALPREPGQSYEYSNVGYGLLAQALARRAHQAYAPLVKARITQLLGMADTSIALTPRMKRRLAQGYTNELAPARRWEMGALEGAGAYSSTANDLLSFLEACLGVRDSPLASALAMMQRARRPGGMAPAQQVALAWNVYRDGERELFWKNGSVGGYRAFLGFDAVRRVGIVALANAQTPVGLDDLGLHALDPSIPVDLSTPVVGHAIAVAPEILERYVGAYVYSPTDKLIVTRQGSQLYGQEPGQAKSPLYAESERDFFFKVMDAQVTFEVSAAGVVSAAIWHQGGQDQRGERER